MLVAEHLDLDVARTFDVLLDVYRIIAERVLRLALRGGERRGELIAGCTTRIPFPPPPAAAFSSTG